MFEAIDMDEKTKNALNKALDADQAGDWKTAHQIVQEIDSSEASLIHAYLHRKEGDPGNARYWYKRAGRDFFTGSFLQEYDELVDYINSKK
jgi:uncharacterized protein YqkB